MARPRNPAIVSRDEEIYARSKAGPYDLTALAKEYDRTPQRIGQIIAAKDAKVYAAWRTGRYTLADLADEYNLTPEQVSEILTARHPAPSSDESGRSVLRARLELFLVAVQDVVENPGFKLAPNGRVACDDDGVPLVDTNAKIEAMRLQLAAFERAAKLEASDKAPPQKQTPQDVAMQQMWAAIAAEQAKFSLSTAERRELEERRRGAGQPVVPGEVIARELPAGGA